MKMNDMIDRQKAKVLTIALREEQIKRLYFLGLYPGAVITRIMCAPMHDPILYMINGVFIVLRSQETSHIEVEVIS